MYSDRIFALARVLSKDHRPLVFPSEWGWVLNDSILTLLSLEHSVCCH